MSTKVRVTYSHAHYDIRMLWDLAPISVEAVVNPKGSEKEKNEILVNICKSSITDPSQFFKYSLLPFPSKLAIAEAWYDICKTYEKEKEEPNVVY